MAIFLILLWPEKYPGFEVKFSLAKKGNVVGLFFNGALVLSYHMLGRREIDTKVIT